MAFFVAFLLQKKQFIFNRSFSYKRSRQLGSIACNAARSTAMDGLPPRYRSFRATRALYSAGMAPVTRLLYKSRCCKEVSSDSAGGSLPITKKNEKEKGVRVRLNKHNVVSRHDSLDHKYFTKLENVYLSAHCRGGQSSRPFQRHQCAHRTTCQWTPWRCPSSSLGASACRPGSRRGSLMRYAACHNPPRAAGWE